MRMLGFLGHEKLKSVSDERALVSGVRQGVVTRGAANVLGFPDIIEEKLSKTAQNEVVTGALQGAVLNAYRTGIAVANTAVEPLVNLNTAPKIDVAEVQPAHEQPETTPPPDVTGGDGISGANPEDMDLTAIRANVASSFKPGE